jgi:hypothetical protein
MNQVCQPQGMAALERKTPLQPALPAAFANSVCQISFEPFFIKYEVLIEVYFSTLVKRVLRAY